MNQKLKSLWHAHYLHNPQRLLVILLTKKINFGKIPLQNQFLAKTCTLEIVGNTVVLLQLVFTLPSSAGSWKNELVVK